METTIKQSQGERQTLRKRILAARDRLSPVEIRTKSDAITSRALLLPEIAEAKTIFTYLHFRSEVQTGSLFHKMVTAQKNVCVPVTLVNSSQLAAVRVTNMAEQVAPGYCGIPEPTPDVINNQTVDPSLIDIVIVPGSVFDRRGGRLGYGGGYYDRFLVNSAPQALRVGFAFELQIVDAVPVEPHDQRMDYIVTETTTIDCRS